MRDFLLVLHIVAVGAWIGGNVTQLLVTPRLRDHGGAVAAAWMTSVVRMGRLLYTPAAILILLTGIALVLNSDLYEFEHVFVAIGVLTVIVGAFFGARVFGPKGNKAAEAFSGGDNEAGATVVNSAIPYSLVDTALVVLTVVAMVGRWGV